MIIKNKLLRRFTSLLVSMTLVVSLLSGCSLKKADNALSEQDIDKIVETVSDEIIDDLKNDSQVDYAGDIETFVCNLLTEQLGYKYDVFPAYTTLSDGTEIYGIAYSDYSKGYLKEDESKCYFSAGMLFYGDEPILPVEEFDAGLEVFNLEFFDEESSFLLEYTSDPFVEHCVVDGKYVQYGVDEKGQIYYKATDYVREEVDESLGSLYSYDESKCLINLDLGEYIYISGESLYAELDFKALEEEVNNIINTQDENFAISQIETYAYQSQESIANYLLSLQEETFLGYDVDELVKAARELEPMECYRLTEEGLMVIEVQEVIGADADTLAEWLVGVGCAVITGTSLIASVAVKSHTAVLDVCIGAVTGAAIEILMQVVVEGEALGDVSWGRVAIATATGAVAGLLGPVISAKLGGVSAFILDTAIDGTLGGIEYAAIAWMEGESGQEIIKSMGYGVALGAVMSAGFKAAGKIVANGVELIKPVVKKLDGVVFKPVSAKVSKVVDDVSAFVAIAKDKLQARLSKHLTKKQAEKILKGLSEKLTFYLKEIIDTAGNVSTYQLNVLKNAIQNGQFSVDEIRIISKKMSELRITDKFEEAMKGINFGQYLRNVMGDIPTNMKDPHAHHILFKEGHGEAQKALVKEGQAILRKHGIDPIIGPENLVWAPNAVEGQHNEEALKMVVEGLKKRDEAGGDYKDIVNFLKEMGQIASGRG